MKGLLKTFFQGHFQAFKRKTGRGRWIEILFFRIFEGLFKAFCLRRFFQGFLTACFQAFFKGWFKTVLKAFKGLLKALSQAF